MDFSLLKLVKFSFLFFLLFATGFITPVNKDYHKDFRFYVAQHDITVSCRNMPSHMVVQTDERRYRGG